MNKKKSKNSGNGIIIFLVVCIIAVIILIYYRSKEMNISFRLNGDSNIIVEYGNNYVDPGFIAKDGNGNSINDYVSVTGIVDINTPGMYKVTYTLDYNDNKLELTRTVLVKNIDINDLDVVLNGASEIYLLKGSSYTEEGAYIIKKSDNTKFEDGIINTFGSVNTNTIGTYEINYVLNYGGRNITISRKVNVFDISYTVTPTTLTPDKVKIIMNIEVANSNISIKLPNGNTSHNRNITYEVDKNGDYSFVVNLNNREFIKTVNVNNIIDNYTCSGEISEKGTKITITPVSNRIKEYQWIINNETIKGDNTFTKNKIVSNAKVNMVFTNNESYEVNCDIKDKLVYHFKFDENNTKPYMKCDTYSAEDKARLDGMLKKVVEDAGYGTRAGVVAAARFLVGGLDYKVLYLGPKEVDPALGRYPQIGLNIGQKGAWGCRVSGWTQGMDCVNFVSWAFAQNGINAYPYNTDNYPVREVINKVRVGDLLYTPCVRSTCKNQYRLDHVGIIIGIDDKYIYVAESIEENTNAIIASKWEKNNMPSSGQFSRVHFFNYPSDGNVTNMWMSE